MRLVFHRRIREQQTQHTVGPAQLTDGKLGELVNFVSTISFGNDPSMVTRVIEPELPSDPIVLVEIEAVFSRAVQVIAWRELKDDRVWRQGWV
jgi:hypothetical protein